MKTTKKGILLNEELATAFDKYEKLLCKASERTVDGKTTVRMEWSSQVFKLCAMDLENTIAESRISEKKKRFIINSINMLLSYTAAAVNRQHILNTKSEEEITEGIKEELKGAE